MNARNIYLNYHYESTSWIPDIPTNTSDFVREDENKNNKQIKIDKYPICLEPYKVKSVNISQISIKSIIANLQYHLGLLSEPGSTEELSNFKEKNILKKERENNCTIRAFRKFIHPKNKDHALVTICVNEGVKTCICQLAVHQDTSEMDKKRCANLLWQSENLSFTERYMTNLIMYQLAKIEEIITEHNKQLQQAVKLQTLNKILDNRHTFFNENASYRKNNLEKNKISVHRNRSMTL